MPNFQDEEFVNTVLVPGLESGDPKYRICLHYRDWIPGEYIQNQILQSVEDSRRTIVVLSSNFIESVWGQLEFKAAHSQALQDRTNRIIVIVYGQVSGDNYLLNIWYFFQFLEGRNLSCILITIDQTNFMINIMN